MRVCRVCGEEKTHIKTDKKLSDGHFLYVDQRGKRWNSRQCPDCLRLECKMNTRRRKGSVPIDEVENEHVKRFRAAERLVQKHFESLGYTTKITDGNGPDLTITKDGETLTVEVKMVFRRPERNSLIVSPVRPLRWKDDLIAYVHKGKIVIRDMADHMRNRVGFSNISVTRFFEGVT